MTIVIDLICLQNKIGIDTEAPKHENSQKGMLCYSVF